MTSTHGVELAAKILQDPAAAVPLLCLLHAFVNAKGNPLLEAMTRDVMLHVWSKIEDCENAMNDFIASQHETDQDQLAA